MTPKIVWIDGWYDSPECVPKQITVLPWAEVVPTPAMTLEEIEKWLKDAFIAANTPQKETCVRNLLAQVREWREATTQRNSTGPSCG